MTTFPEYLGQNDQSFATVVGDQYTLSYDVQLLTLGSGGIASITLGTALGAADVLNQGITSTGSKSHNFQATSTTTWLRNKLDGLIGGGPYEMQLDNISVPGVTLTTVKDGGLAQYIAGVADNWDIMRIAANAVGDVRNPLKTTMLEDLEKEYGIFSDSNLTEAVRRDKLAGVIYARESHASISNLQTALDRSFTGFTVYDNNPAVDPSKVISSNAIADGMMESSDVLSWTAGSSATLTKQTTDPMQGTRYMKIARNGSANPYAFQNTLVSGDTYTARGFARGDGTATPRLAFGSAWIWDGTSSTDWQYFEVSGVANGVFRIGAITNTGTEFVEFDAVVVSKSGTLIVNGQIFDSYTDWVGGCGEAGAECGEADMQCGENNGIVKTLHEYPYPTNADTWPLVFFVGGSQQGYSILRDGAMEYQNLTEWTALNSATLTKETGTPHGGLRSLRVTRNGVDNPASGQTVLVSGVSYRVRGWVRSDGISTPMVGIGNPAIPATTSTDWHQMDFTETAVGNDIYLWHDGGGTSWAEFDDFTVEPQNFPIHQMECGEALSQCGEQLAQCGTFNGAVQTIAAVDVDADRQADLERLILAMKPMHAWCVLFVNYT